MAFKILRIGSLLYFLQKLGCSLKKKKKVFTSISSLISLFSPKIKVFSEKKNKKRSSLRIVLYTLNKHLQQIETVTLKQRY